MSQRFFVPLPPLPGPFTITGPEAHHLAHVCRLHAGAAVVLFCGDGRDYPAVVTEVHKRQVELRVEPGLITHRELPRLIWLAAPLPKADRATFLIEKLTELGVSRYVPLVTERTVIHPSEGKTDKLRRTVIEACKQCGRNVLMAIDMPQRLADFLRRSDLPPGRYLGEASGPPGPPVGGQDSVFLVGPEGGLTATEQAAAHAALFQPLSLGPRILRIETAALALVARSLEGCDPKAKGGPT